METFLRSWRQDALNKHQYDSAIFIGDKVLALTNDDQDAFWLAQVHFTTGNYTRAQGFLSRRDLIARNPSCRYLAAHCLIKQYKYDEALAVLGERDPIHLLRRTSNSRRKLQHDNGRSGSSKAGGKQGASKLDRGWRRSEEDTLASGEDAADIKFEAAMCYLRGLCYAKQNAFDRAKECYKDAVRIDVQCYEAFDQLMKNSLMSPDEEWEFLELLDFDSITVVGGTASSSQEAAEFTKMLYTTRLSKYKNAEVFEAATETLSTHYNLASNPDLLLSRAELLFTQCRFTEALSLTQSILSADKYNFAIYPLHLACLHELNQRNTLFLISHDLVDHHPEEPCAWLAIGIYYLTIGRIADSRRFFSKASMMDPHFGPAWIGFAHTFAAEGEHDQAISAYSTAARLFQGTHLPQLFLGMQNLQLNNMTLADEYLKTAYDLCKSDPLLMNEMGVVYYHQDQLQAALDMFTTALEIADAIAASSIGGGGRSTATTTTTTTAIATTTAATDDPRAWVATRANLAHTFRRLGMWSEALASFDEVLRQGGRDAGVFCAKAIILLELGRPLEAVQVLHEALAVSPQDPVATDLLAKALEETSLADPPPSTTSGGGGAARRMGTGTTTTPAASFASAGVADADGGGGGGGSAGNVEDEFESLLRLRKKDALEARTRRRVEKLESALRKTRGGAKWTMAGTGTAAAVDAGDESSMMVVSDDEG